MLIFIFLPQHINAHRVVDGSIDINVVSNNNDISATVSCKVSMVQSKRPIFEVT